LPQLENKGMGKKRVDKGNKNQGEYDPAEAISVAFENI